MSEETTTTDDTMDAQLAEEPRQDTAGGSADHHDPDHMAAEVRWIVLERAVRNSRERG